MPTTMRVEFPPNAISEPWPGRCPPDRLLCNHTEARLPPYQAEIRPSALVPAHRRKGTIVLDRTRDANIREIAQDKLFALQNPMKLDGRVSSYPASARGYSVTNCYLLRQPDAAWLIDTG